MNRELKISQRQFRKLIKKGKLETYEFEGLDGVTGREGSIYTLDFDKFGVNFKLKIEIGEEWCIEDLDGNRIDDPNIAEDLEESEKNIVYMNYKDTFKPMRIPRYDDGIWYTEYTSYSAIKEINFNVDLFEHDILDIIDEEFSDFFWFYEKEAANDD